MCGCVWVSVCVGEWVDVLVCMGECVCGWVGWCMGGGIVWVDGVVCLGLWVYVCG